MMKKWFLLGLLIFSVGFVKAAKPEKDYLIVASSTVKEDAEWMKVVEALRQRHHAQVCFYRDSLGEVLPYLQQKKPRYVAFVEMPKYINREYVMELHRISRKVDDNPYVDYLWGIITGYDATQALKLVHNANEPLVVKSALSTISELSSAKWFDRYAWMDDHTDGLCGEKWEADGKVKTYMINPEKESLRKFYDLYEKIDPDFVVTSGHATERNLETPFSHGNIKSKNGILYAAFPDGKENLVESGKRRVFLGAGNCLIGNVRNNPNSMAIAWLGSGNATAMVGYVVTSWYGRSGWGALKYWISNPGRYTLAEAVYLNEQDMLHQMNEWNADFNKINYPYAVHEVLFRKSLHAAEEAIREGTGIKRPTKDQIGFLYDRDVLAYYGDPKWNVRLQPVAEEQDYTVDYKITKKKCIITIKTGKDFDLNRMLGANFKQVHVKNLPFSCFFPKRLNHPVPEGDYPWNIVCDDDFMFIYNPDFKADSVYKIVLNMD